ncbi:MAG TPA: CoA-transferase [Mycobacteriales bacterium]|nr:CoA-transferase [Mycobacteriales bacterium]
MTAEDVVAQLRSGMTLGIGGWGPRRKPMSLVRAILRSDLKDLTVVSYGGPDVGMLCAAGKIKKLVYAFVSLDSIPLEPHFQKTRQAGAIESVEYDEGMFQWGLLAAAHRLPFLPIRAGLGSDVQARTPGLKTVTSPYPGPDGVAEELMAMPALTLDAALVHVNRADTAGNGQILDRDPYFDDLFCMAAEKAYVSAEKVVAPGELPNEGPIKDIRVLRLFTDGVVEAPLGAHPTQCDPDYQRDEAAQKAYAATAESDEAWTEYVKTYVDAGEDAYRAAFSGSAA